MIYRINERSSFTFRARMDDELAEATTITYAIFPTGVTTAVASGSLTPTDVQFTSLQTDSKWKADSIGYNFKHVISHTAVTTHGLFRIEYVFTVGATLYRIDPIEIRANDMYTL